MLNYITNYLSCLWDAIIMFLYSGLQIGVALFFFALAVCSIFLLVCFTKAILFEKEDEDVGQADE